MRRSELHYDLPAERIAQRPAEPRDASRLLVLHRASGRIEHRRFAEIGAYLRAGDCLVVNDTRVIPARFFCRRGSGGRVEGLFLREEGGRWRVLLKPSSRLRTGERLDVVEAGADGRPTAGPRDPASRMGAGPGIVLLESHERGEWSVTPDPPIAAAALLDRVGQTPLPPYIERAAGPDGADRERYQTVFARSPGAVAAPTAGLHFTAELLARLSAAGVGRAEVTLHVGLGTFAAIDVEELSEHVMHPEWYEVGGEALEALRRTRRAGGRIVAVGTTSARVLESIDLWEGAGASRRGWTDLFIYPPYRFRNVDALVTNFHLPGSTLLALVMALAGVEAIRGAYACAIAEGYRFFSYGDAMLIE